MASPKLDLTTSGLGPAERGMTLKYLKEWINTHHGQNFWHANGLCATCMGFGKDGCQ